MLGFLFPLHQEQCYVLSLKEWNIPIIQVLPTWALTGDTATQRSNVGTDAVHLAQCCLALTEFWGRGLGVEASISTEALVEAGKVEQLEEEEEGNQSYGGGWRDPPTAGDQPREE